MTQPSEQRWDKLAIVVLCGFSIGVLGGISYGAISKEIPDNAHTLLGVIVGGLMLFARECLQAIRQFAQDVNTTRLTEQLGNSTPLPVEPPPAGTVEAAQATADAAQAKADRIAGENP